MGPGDLKALMDSLPLIREERPLLGYETGDDAGVYLLNETQALIQTVDFITPIVDDPYVFGQIAAANSLSDVYAMGGRPLTALNICCFPDCGVERETLGAILQGGLSKIRESGAFLLGGHTVQDKELKYGLSVTGEADPRRILKRIGAQAGDVLILTKPLGTGIISTAVKGGLAEETSRIAAQNSMTKLNRVSGELLAEYEVHAATDVTGFGLLGHLREMIRGEDLTVELSFAAVPLFSGVEELLQLGMVPQGAYRNWEFSQTDVELRGPNSDRRLILSDPQTSGGLLMTLPEKRAKLLLDILHQEGFEAAQMIGQFESRRAKPIIVAP